MNTNPGVLLVGDGIENPANALTMIHAAAMFEATCRFRDTKGLAEGQEGAAGTIEPITSLEVQAQHSRIIAFDNLPGAHDVYGFRAGREFAVLMGNERRGLSREFTALATDRVQVPMFSRRINCLNVAAASAVALYYLTGPAVGAMATRTDPRRRRPEVLLLGAADHFELGSTVRSAAGLGWERVFVEDRHKVWFGCDRATRSEGRAAARRGKNEILLVPCPMGAAYHYPRVTVITRKATGTPLPRANLAVGPTQLVVIPDEAGAEQATEDWSRLGKQVEFVHVQLPAADFPYHYRLLATIALAEISRQVGRRPPVKVPLGPRPPIYDHGIGKLAEAAGQFVELDELLRY